MLLLFYIVRPNVESAIDGIVALPPSVRPTHFTADEEKVREHDAIDDESRFATFRRQNRSGFFLIGPRCKYNLSLRSNDYSILSVDVTGEFSEEETFVVCASMLRARAEYGFAATEEEYYHRNRIYCTIGDANIESWVGRDLRKYVPGVFWRTVLSQRLIAERQLDLRALPSCVQVERIDDSVILKVTGRMGEWKARAAEIDNFCASVTGFFSITHVVNDLVGVDDYLKFSQILAPWR
ncbi:MAG: hypothetical protein HY288_07425 [Planctomycetia bacterium]|nr:hypothetical protein [Planctomycetia bacterium]